MHCKAASPGCLGFSPGSCREVKWTELERSVIAIPARMVKKQGGSINLKMPGFPDAFVTLKCNSVMKTDIKVEPLCLVDSLSFLCLDSCLLS